MKDRKRRIRGRAGSCSEALLLILLIIAGTLIATLFFSAVLHEISHALAAGLMGIKIREINFGGGPLLLRTGLGRISIMIRLFPGRGSVRHLPASQTFRRWRLFVLVAAGPACDILILLALIAAIRQPGLGEHLVIALAFAIGTQGYFAFSNLWPRTSDRDDGSVPNDGMQMLQILIHSYAVATPAGAEQPIEHVVYEGMVEQYLPAGQSIPVPSQRSPEVLDYIVSRHFEKEPIGPDMAARMESALSGNLAVCEQLLLLDALVTATLSRSDHQSLKDLDRWSARAYELGAGIATLRASRGSVLIATGRAAEGLALLENSLDGAAFNDCLVHAFRALAHFNVGDEAQARREFAAAKALFKHEEWNGQDIARMVERVGRTIGEELKSPATWSAEAARAAFRNRTSGRPAQPDRP
jgi:hypothetical protein